MPGRKALRELGTIFTPIRCFNGTGELVTRRWTFVERRWPGRPRIRAELMALVVRVAMENRSWRYTWIRGAMANLKYKLGGEQFAGF
jgi:putative transposase